MLTDEEIVDHVQHMGDEEMDVESLRVMMMVST